MNNVQLVGNLTADPEERHAKDATGKTSVTFTVAVNRNYKNAQGVVEADFIRCVAWDKTADFIKKNFGRGKAIGIIGSIRTNSYTNKDGVKVYTTEVYVSSAEFVGNKNGNAGGSAPAPIPTTPGKGSEDFMNIPAGIDEELPW